jgi:hypothetical protein
MDDIASSHIMKTMLLSLRKKGKFTGSIVIVTDRLKCLLQNLGDEVLGAGQVPVRKSDQAVVYNGTYGFYHIVTVAPPRSRAARIIMGPQIFEQHKGLARTHASNALLPFELGTVIGIDEDILITEPVKPFLEHVETCCNHDLAVFQDQGKAHAWFHCGLVVSYPGSEDCMNQWVVEDIRQSNGWAVPEAFSFLEQIAGTPESNRASSLLEISNDASMEGIGQKAFSSTRCAKEGRVVHLDKSFLSFPTKESITKNASTMFIHFSNQYRLKQLLKSESDRLSMQNFIRNIVGLDSDIMSTDNCTDYELFRYVKNSTPPVWINGPDGGHYGIIPPAVNEVSNPSGIRPEEELTKSSSLLQSEKNVS